MLDVETDSQSTDKSTEILNQNRFISTLLYAAIHTRSTHQYENLPRLTLGVQTVKNLRQLPRALIYLRSKCTPSNRRRTKSQLDNG